ncbi:MAG: hypothetical protein RI935_39 [Candidatus Parcubacteria bacterium]|jgi:glutamyl-tRNA synthetase
MSSIVTRFAPSPTGLLHLGNYRTAVFAYLYAKKMGGSFILRIEDTDRERSKEEYKENILESLTWLGLAHDKLYIQSENLNKHTAYLNQLITQGYAYISKEEAKDGSGVMRELVRFKNTGEVVVFDDLIRGRIEIDTTDLGDFVIAKSVTEPLFHLAVVVDDYEANVTHVIRGEDHIPNTPRQILIAKALGFKIPLYAHLPLVLSPDRTKLSKRKGALPVTYYRDKGFLPEALINFMAFIGWNPGGEKEIFSTQELIELFDIARIHKAGAIFNEEKLLWMNKEHLKMENAAAVKKMIAPYFREYDEELLDKMLPFVVDRISYYGQLSTLEQEEFGFLKSRPEVNGSLILWKDDTKEDTSKHLISVLELLLYSDFYSPATIKESVMPYATEHGKGNVLWPLRVALSGKEKSLDPFTICYLLGYDEVKTRIRNAVVQLEQTT